MKNFLKQHSIVYVVIFIALILPFVVQDEYKIRVMNVFFLYAVVSMSINLIVGTCGLLDMGRAAFMGLGAYCSAIFSVKLGMPFLFSFMVAGCFTGVILSLIHI